MDLNIVCLICGHELEASFSGLGSLQVDFCSRCRDDIEDYELGWEDGYQEGYQEGKDSVDE
jgi:hypothetical protein